MGCFNPMKDTDPGKSRPPWVYHAAQAMRDKDPMRSVRNIASITYSLLLLCASGVLHAQAPANPPIQVVRVGYGNLEGLKASISAYSEACRVAKHLPPQDVALPSDDYLTKFVAMEVEELFDGQRYAKFTTQRQIAPDATSGCTLAVFASRSATSDLVCVSRIRGGTPLIGEEIDFDNPSTASPTIFEDALNSPKCNEKPLTKNAAGVPRVDAGGQKCFWNADLIALQMAKFTHSAPGPKTGFDICLYEALPTYYYKGMGEPVVLMSKVFGEPEGGTVLERTTGAVRDMNLKSFSANQAIPKSRFERSAIERFLNQPMKSSL